MILRSVALTLIALSIALPAAAQQSVTLQTNSFVNWDESDDGAKFVWGDLVMDLELVPISAEEPYIDGALLHVKGAAGGAFTIAASAGSTGLGQIGVFEVDSRGGPSIVFGAYTGGAHCCTALYSAWLGDGEPVQAQFGDFDGGLAVLDDLDGDGTFELVSRDDRFNYNFDSYAGSFPPLMVLKTAGGHVIDVTTAAEFTPAVERDFARLRSFCGGEDSWYAGACASLLADAARLGRYDAVRAELAAHVEAGGSFETAWEDFSFCRQDGCAVQEDFTALLPAVDYALQQWGYLQ